MFKSYLTRSISFFRSLSWSQSLSARCSSVFSTAHLCTRGCSERKCRYLPVCVGFRYTFVLSWSCSIRAFLDTLIAQMEHGQFSIKVYRKPTHTGKYLHFRSEHPLVHKCAVLNTLLHRADKLCDQESERKKEIDLVRSTLKQNGYPDRLLYREKSVNATKNQEHETRGLVLLP